jgi:hypothetical protein
MGFRTRSVVLVAAALLSAIAAFGAVVPSLAAAAYPGGAGALVYQDSYAYTDPTNNGVTTYQYDLTAARAPHTGSGRMLGCIGFDYTFTDGPGFCAQSGAAFSPDGSTIVTSGFSTLGDTAGTTVPDQSTPGPSPSALILTNADGSDPRLLQPAVFAAREPAFMPGGTAIVFTGHAAQTSGPQLYTVGLDGTGLRQITTVGASQAAPCPNGTVLYAHRGNLYLLSADLRHTRRLTYRGGAFPDCSRDSRTMVFVRHRTLYTLTTAGEQLRRLSPTDNAAQTRPSLSPAGGAVAYVAADVCTTRACRQQGNVNRCDFITYRLKVVSLRAKLERSYKIGSNACTGDGDLGGDSFGAVAWQPTDLVARRRPSA